VSEEGGAATVGVKERCWHEGPRPPMFRKVPEVVPGGGEGDLLAGPSREKCNFLDAGSR